MRRRGVQYILFLCICLLLSGCINRSISMKMKLKKGDSYKVEVDSGEKITQNIKGGQMIIESKMRVGYLCQVTNIDQNKNADIKVSFDTIEVKNNISNGQKPSNGGTAEGESNSNQKEGSDESKTENKEKTGEETKANEQSNTSGQKEPPEENKQALSNGMDKLSKIYTALIGKSFDVKIGEYGKVKSVTGTEDIVNKILTEMNIKDEKEKDDIKKVMKDQFGVEAITTRIERVTAVYPNKDVKPGENWKEKRDASAHFPVEAENNYSLKESADGTSDITIDGQIKGKEDAEPTIIDNIKISYEDMKGTQKGNISVNEETGMIKRAELESKFSGIMKFMSNDPNMGSVTFPISVEEKTRVNVLRQ